MMENLEMENHQIDAETEGSHREDEKYREINEGISAVCQVLLWLEVYSLYQYKGGRNSKNPKSFSVG